MTFRVEHLCCVQFSAIARYLPYPLSQGALPAVPFRSNPLALAEMVRSGGDIPRDSQKAKWLAVRPGVGAAGRMRPRPDFVAIGGGRASFNRPNDLAIKSHVDICQRQVYIG